MLKLSNSTILCFHVQSNFEATGHMKSAFFCFLFRDVLIRFNVFLSTFKEFYKEISVGGQRNQIEQKIQEKK